MHLADNAQLQTAEAAFFLIPFAADAASTAGHLTEKKNENNYIHNESMNLSAIH